MCMTFKAKTRFIHACRSFVYVVGIFFFLIHFVSLSKQATINSRYTPLSDRKSKYLLLFFVEHFININNYVAKYLFT